MSFTCEVQIQSDAQQRELEGPFKAVVPGIYVKVRSRGLAYRYAEITVHDHGVLLLHDALAAKGYDFRWVTPPLPATDPIATAADALARLETLGILRPNQIVMLKPYQVEGVGRAIIRGNFYFDWACGSGKTRAAILRALAWALPRKRPIIAASRVADIRKWGREIRQVTTVEPHVWLAKSHRRKRYVETADYLRACAASGVTPFVVVGYENLGDALADLKPLQKAFVVFDEIHRVRSHKRWDPTINPDGTTGFDLKDNIAAAAMLLAKQAEMRLGMSATMIPDRLRGLWAQLDLVEPWGFGKFYDFCTRYCNAHPGPWGGIDTSGASNVDELVDRLAYIRHHVSQDEVAQHMPPKRRECHWLAAEDLIAPLEGWKSQLKHAEKQGEESAIEAQLAVTASKKRRWVCDAVVDALKCGQKVLVLTGFRKDADALGEMIAKAAPIGAHVGWTHGGYGPEHADVACLDYMWLDFEVKERRPGPACLVATGDSIGESQNLQDTDWLLQPHLPFTPGQVTQREGRVARLGQLRPVRITYVIAEGTYDERVASLLLEKLPVVATVTGDAEAGEIAQALKGIDDRESLIAALAANMTTGRGEWSIDFGAQDA